MPIIAYGYFKSQVFIFEKYNSLPSPLPTWNTLRRLFKGAEFVGIHL